MIIEKQGMIIQSAKTKNGTSCCAPTVKNKNWIHHCIGKSAKREGMRAKGKEWFLHSVQNDNHESHKAKNWIPRFVRNEGHQQIHPMTLSHRMNRKI